MVLALFIIPVLGCGIAIGFLCPPGEWYARLAKPSFNPPNWLFAPAWTVLYGLIAIAGWRTWDAGAGAAFAVWLAQLIVNFAWSPAFFRAHRGDIALALIVVLLALILAFIGLQWNADRIAAMLFLPYAAWVAFAATLNAALLRLNGDAVRGAARS
jgi:tryptophan-rich sensory protein